MHSYGRPDAVDPVAASSAEQGGTYGHADPVESGPDDVHVGRVAWSGYRARIPLALGQHATACGSRRVMLETGARDIAALALYADTGHLPTDPYMNGRDPEINGAFIKRLTGSR